MRADAVKLIEAFLAALNDSDRSAALALADEDVVLDIAPGIRKIGREELKWWIVGRQEAGQFSFADIAAMATEDGSRGAAEFTLRSRSAEGQASSVNAGMFFAISGGRIERISCCNLPSV